MATKTISVTEEAYEILKSWREGNESFSEIITKIGKKKDYTKYAGMLSDKQVSYLSEKIIEGRKHWRGRK